MNFALTDEQEFLQRGRARRARRASRRSRRRARRSTAARCPTCGRPPWRPAGRACWCRGAAAAPGSARSTRCSCSPSSAACWRACRCSATCRRRCCSTRGAATALEALAAGERRAAFVAAQPPRRSRRRGRSTRAPGCARAPAPVLDERHGDRRGRLGAGRARRRRARRSWAPTARVGAGARRRTPRSSRSRRYDATRSLGHVRLDARAGDALPDADAGDRVVPRAGAARRRVARRGRGARSRRPSPTPRSASRSAARSAPTRRSSTSSWRSCAGSRTPARSCTTPAGRPQDRPDELPLAAAAFRLVAGGALDHAARAQISVHGGIGATWEHDAPLYFRRAQLVAAAARRRRRRAPTAWPASCSSPGAGGRLTRCTSGPTTAGGSRSPSTTGSRSTSTGCCASAWSRTGTSAPDEVHEAEAVPWAWLEAVHDPGWSRASAPAS